MLVTLNIHALEAHPRVVNADILQSGDIQESMLPIAKADPELHARSSKVIYPMSSLLAGTPNTAPFTLFGCRGELKAGYRQSTS